MTAVQTGADADKIREFSVLSDAACRAHRRHSAKGPTARLGK